MKIFEGAQNCSDPPCLEKEELVTFEKVGMDFVSLKGIQTKIGVGADKLLIFVLKEFVDNALDFIDRSGKPNPVVIVSVREEEGNKIKVTVANSDFGLVNSGFTEPSVRIIFNLAGYYSTKRNQYRIARGALGDALKTVCGNTDLPIMRIKDISVGILYPTNCFNYLIRRTIYYRYKIFKLICYIQFIISRIICNTSRLPSY